MKIPVVSHFWNAAGVAQWRPLKFPLPEIEKSVKDDYAILQYEKPPTRRYGKYLAILRYDASRDVFNREIVSIKFAFVDDEIRSPEIESAIRDRLDRLDDNEAFLRVYPSLINIKKYLSARRASVRRLALYGGLVICALVVSAFLFERLTKTPGSPSGPSIVAPARIDKGVADTLDLNVAPVFGPYRTPSETKESDVCRAARNENILLKCPRSYLLAICGDSHSGPYRAWREKSESCRQARRNNFAVGKDVFLERPPEPLASEILKTLFP